ncbi:MAG: hypothetical protein HYR94_02200 [Chloroflexi bacterium]|nr:hypothetical protein [Chloroflexota bacterium]
METSDGKTSGSAALAKGRLLFRWIGSFVEIAAKAGDAGGNKPPNKVTISQI